MFTKSYLHTVSVLCTYCPQPTCLPINLHAAYVLPFCYLCMTCTQVVTLYAAYTQEFSLCTSYDQRSYDHLWWGEGWNAPPHTPIPYAHTCMILCVCACAGIYTHNHAHNFTRLHSQLHVQRHLAPQIHTHVFLELHHLMLTFVSTLNRIHIGLNCETMLNCSTLGCRPTSHQTTSHHICTTWITCTCFNDSMVRSSICPKSRYCKTARYAVYVMVNVEGIFHHCTVLQRDLI